MFHCDDRINATVNHGLTARQIAWPGLAGGDNGYE